MGMIKKKKCRNCKYLFVPDPRNQNRQEYCDKTECLKASKAASQKKWLTKPENKDYFTGPDNVKRVQEWRKKNPDYWKRSKKPVALQDDIALTLLRMQQSGLDILCLQPKTKGGKSDCKNPYFKQTGS